MGVGVGGCGVGVLGIGGFGDTSTQIGTMSGQFDATLAATLRPAGGAGSSQPTHGPV